MAGEVFRVRNILVSSMILAGSIVVPDMAKAQSSVSMYGLISAGFFYVPNYAGHSRFAFFSGPEQLPRFGLRGTEDLGAGTQAIFDLENGFSIANGALGQGGRLFGRQAWVGLASNSYGTVTLGRQYDEMVQELAWSESAVQFASFGTHVGDNDNLYNDVRFNNSVRYASPEFAGVKLAAQYAFSNSTGFRNNNAYSFGLYYQHDAFRMGAAVSQFNQPASSTNTQGAVDSDEYGYSSPFIKSQTGAAASLQRIFGTGFGYDFGVINATFVYTNVLFNYLDSSGLRLQNGELTLTHRSGPLLVGAGYTFTFGRYSSGATPKYQQLNVGLVYTLSKRTDLSLIEMIQRAGGSAQHAQIYNASPSSTRNQVATVAGLRVRF